MTVELRTNSEEFLDVSGGNTGVQMEQLHCLRSLSNSKK